MENDYSVADNPPYRVSGNSANPSCRPQSYTLFGGSAGYGPSGAWPSGAALPYPHDATNLPHTPRGQDLYERSCKYVTSIGLLARTDYVIDNTVNVEYEVEKASTTQPYFKFGLSPFPDTCIYNCRIDFTFTVDGGTPCSIVWAAAGDTNSVSNRWSLKDCTVSNAGLGSNRQLKLDNRGTVTLLGGSPYSEDTFHYKIDATVVGYNSFSLEGDFKLLCSSATTVITQPNDFSTSIISFLKSSGFQTFNFPEFTATECPIAKYEVTSYSSN